MECYKQEERSADDLEEEEEEEEERGIDQNDDDEPVSPMGQYCNSSALESEVTNEQGEKHWKKVVVKLEDHLKVPVYPDGLSPESYNEYLQEYLTQIGMEQLPWSRPLWEVHIFKYTTSSSVAGTVVFKLHHSLGDGYSLMGALFTCLKRADDPSLPFTFPSDYKKKKKKDEVSPIRSATVGVEFRPVSITTVTFSLDQIKQTKAKVGGTYQRHNRRYNILRDKVIHGICKKGFWQVTFDSNDVILNTREMTSYQTVKEMAKQDNKGPWGNNFAFLHVSIPESVDIETADSLEFVFKAKKNDHEEEKFTGCLSYWYITRVD
ncbi:O-acyltransferase [Macleaya cordata]|uniref:diacylglycerol O-acyltransferase n=1 Tax=Macleaya cordata TaxID=56857 RepID=A0A200PQC6_MACCD|nr:O-acyltransferase [Macleaya cordata]